MLDSLGNPTLHIIAQIFYKEDIIKVSDKLLFKKKLLLNPRCHFLPKNPSSYNGIMGYSSIRM